MDQVLLSTPDNPAPGNHVAGFFENRRGHRLRYAVFRSERTPARGTIILVHGRNEFIEKYFETICDLTAMGFWVATFDLRGQGLSHRLLQDATRGHIRRFRDYEEDLDDFIERVVLPDARLPLHLVAHSTGGLMALSAAPRLNQHCERLVLAAPFVGLTGQSLSLASIKRLSGAFCALGLGQVRLRRKARDWNFPQNPLTTDEARYQRNRKLARDYPQLVLGAPTARWIYESVKTIERVTRSSHLTSITVPTIILAPTRDQIVPFAAQEGLARYFRAAQFIPVTGARHELFSEQDRFRRMALAAIDAFLPAGDISNVAYDHEAPLGL